MTKVQKQEERESGCTFFEIENEYIKVRCTNLGCHLLSIYCYDREHNFEDILLGYEDVEIGCRDGNYMGAIVGRVANRIRSGRFVLHNKQYQLAQNNGNNHLHGGIEGYHTKLFDYKIKENGIVFQYQSLDMEEGYPGNLKIQISYYLKDMELEMVCEAEADQDTLCNLANHAYFNLSAGKEKIYDHDMKICASKVGCIDQECCVTGEQLKVEGTPFDFREFHKIGEKIFEEDEQLRNGKGYDHPYFLEKTEGEPQIAIWHRASGRKMSIYTTLPSVQVYTANVLAGGCSGKNGVHYENRDGIALETQAPPDSINLEEKPRVLLRKGEKYREITRYRFEIE